MERNIYQSRVAERSMRKSVHLPATLIVDGVAYDGVLMNISACGLGMYIDTRFHEQTIGCTQGSILTVEFTSLTGELIALRCRICWLRFTNCAGSGITTSMGMEVIDPPRGFLSMYNRLI